jgi:hypothetical protein
LKIHGDAQCHAIGNLFSWEVRVLPIQEGEMHNLQTIANIDILAAKEVDPFRVQIRENFKVMGNLTST